MWWVPTGVFCRCRFPGHNLHLLQVLREYSLLSYRYQSSVVAPFTSRSACIVQRNVATSLFTERASGRSPFPMGLWFFDGLLQAARSRVPLVYPSWNVPHCAVQLVTGAAVKIIVRDSFPNWPSAVSLGERLLTFSWLLLGQPFPDWSACSLFVSSRETLQNRDMARSKREVSMRQPG